MIPDFESLSLALNLGVFAVAAGFVWLGGDRIAHYADSISERTGMGQAMLGLILLGGVTSLPEVAVSLTAAAGDNAALAVNNVLGGVAMQVAVLALADFLIRKRALTASAPDPVVLLQGVLGILMLAAVAAAITMGDRNVLGVGLWSWGILALFLFSVRQLSVAEHAEKPWIANLGEEQKKDLDARERKSRERREQAKKQAWPLLIAKTAGAALLILVAGFVVAKTGEAIAGQTGLGDSFVGVALVAIATSLPEVSTVTSAVRLGLYTMAISDILGTNLFDIALVFGIDAVAGGEPVLSQVGAFSTFGALLGIVVTGVYLAGLAERRDNQVWRFGWDSVFVIVLYLGGLYALYTLR